MSHADGGRIIHIAKRREREREDFEKQKQLLEEQQIVITERFTSNNEVKADTSLPTDVVGLVKLEDMKEKHKNYLAPK